MTMFVAGKSAGNLMFMMRALASSKKRRAAKTLPEMRRGTTVMPESYYSRWDEGIALKHFR